MDALPSLLGCRLDWRLDPLNHFGFNLDLHFVAHQPAAALQGDVPVQPEIFAADGGFHGERANALAIGVLALTLKGDIQGHFERDAMNCQIAQHMVAILALLLHLLALIGDGGEMLDIEEIRRAQMSIAPSLAVSMVTSSSACSGFCSSRSVTTVNFLNCPRTVVTIICLTENPMELCA